MKKRIQLIGVAAVLLLATTTFAQTNVPAVPNLLPTNAPTASSPIWNDLGNVLGDIGLSSNPTNYAAGVFYGHSLSGNKSALGIFVVENVTANVGVIAGVDTLWGGGKIGSANIVSGGLTLKALSHPLRFISSDTNSWAYNMGATPYAVALVCMPINGTGSADGGLGAIARAGVNLDLYNFHGWELALGVDYGNRTGSGNYDGNWIDVLFNVRKGF